MDTFKRDGPLWGMGDAIRCSLLALVLLACAGEDKETGRPSEDSGCPSLSDQACDDKDTYTCDACGQAYFCGAVSMEGDLGWGITAWDCDCISQEGELVLYDTATQTGNPECLRTE